MLVVLTPWRGAALIVCKQTIAAAAAPEVGSCRVCFANAGDGDDRDRTGDPLLAKQVLSQLSYAPNLEPHSAKQGQSPAATWPHTPTALNEAHWWAREDLNLRPHAYQACALTN